MRWCVSVSFLAGAAAGVATPSQARAQHDPDQFKMTLVFDGKKQVDGRGTATHLVTDPKSGRLVGKEERKTSVPLPIRVSFEKLPGSVPKLSSRDCRFAVLDPDGNVLPARIMLPYDSDPKTGYPTGPVVRGIAMGDKPSPDDPKMSRDRGGDLLTSRLKPGRYSLICVMRGQIVSVAFQLQVE